jgi:hypothetical protein
VVIGCQELLLGVFPSRAGGGPPTPEVSDGQVKSFMLPDEGAVFGRVLRFVSADECFDAGEYLLGQGMGFALHGDASQLRARPDEASRTV